MSCNPFEHVLAKFVGTLHNITGWKPLIKLLSSPSFIRNPMHVNRIFMTDLNMHRKKPATDLFHTTV